MRTTLKAYEAGVRLDQNLASLFVLRQRARCEESERIYSDVFGKVVSSESGKKRELAALEEEEEEEGRTRARECSVVFCKFLSESKRFREIIESHEKGPVSVVDCSKCFDERDLDDALEEVLEIVERMSSCNEERDGEESAKGEDSIYCVEARARAIAIERANARGGARKETVRSAVYGYASNDLRQRTTVFVDDLSIVAFAYGAKKAIEFVRRIQRMEGVRNVFARVTVSSASGSMKRDRNENNNKRFTRRRNNDSATVYDILANDASCSCAMTIRKSTKEERRTMTIARGDDDDVTLFTAETKRGASRKTKETDIVQFVKVNEINERSFVRLEYTSIDDARRNAKEIQEMRDQTRSEKLAEKMNKFSTFNLGTAATAISSRELEAKRNVRLAFQHEGDNNNNTSPSQRQQRGGGKNKNNNSDSLSSFREQLPRDAGGTLGNRGEGHGEKLKNLLEYERDGFDEHDYGSGVDTDEEIDDLDDF